MLMSIHRCDNQGFFPCREDSYPNFTGEGRGAGYNVNMAWHGEKNRDKPTGSNEYKYACDHVLLPIAKEFKPDIILISCGFDSAIHDQLGAQKLSPLGYYYMTTELLKICPKMVVCLEGGYNTDYLG